MPLWRHRLSFSGTYFKKRWLYRRLRALRSFGWKIHPSKNKIYRLLGIQQTDFHRCRSRDDPFGVNKTLFLPKAKNCGFSGGEEMTYRVLMPISL
jgi:hypothetical protein